MYLRAVLCTFQISVDFLLCTCGWERRGERRVEREGDRMYTVWVQLTVNCNPEYNPSHNAGGVLAVKAK